MPEYTECRRGIFKAFFKSNELISCSVQSFPTSMQLCLHVLGTGKEYISRIATFPNGMGFFTRWKVQNFQKDCVYVKPRKRDASVWTKRGGIELYSDIFSSATQGFFLPLNLRVWPFSSEPFVSFLSEKKKKKERFYRSLSFISSLNFFLREKNGRMEGCTAGRRRKKDASSSAFFSFPSRLLQ